MIDNTYNRFKRYTKKKDRDVRWAEPEEIKNETTRIDLTADTCPTSGLPIICDTKTAWVDGSDNHTLIFGSTGSKRRGCL
jgi:type IV secretion system protein VirD4